MDKFEFVGDWLTEIRLSEFAKLNNPQLIRKKPDGNKGLYILTIDDEKNSNPDPENEQLNTLNYLLDSKNQSFIIEAVFEYIKNIVYPKYQEFLHFDEYPECYPELNNLSDLYNVIGINEVIVRTFHKNNHAYYVLGFNSCLDYEHGLYLTLHQTRVIDDSEMGDLGVEKIIIDQGLDYKEFREKSFIKDALLTYQPNPKYGKLKPWQEFANEYYPFGLYHDNLNERLIQEINSGKIPKEPTCSRLLSMAINAKREDLIEFLITQNPQFKRDSFVTALENDRYDLLNKLILLGYNVNESIAQDSSFHSTIWELQKNIDDEVISLKIQKRLVFLLSKGLNVYLEDEYKRNALSIIGRIDNLDKREKTQTIIENILKN